MTQRAASPAKTYRLMYVGRSSAQIERDFGARLSRLIREGFEVHVLAADDGGFEALERRGVYAKPIPVGRTLNLPGLVGAYFIIQAYFIEYEPVLVHAFDDVLTWLGAYAAHRVGTPAVFATVQRHAFVVDPVRVELDTLLPVSPRLLENVEGFVNTIVGGRLRRGLFYAYEWLGEQVDKYFVINEHDFGALQDLGLVPPEKLEMIIGGNGVMLDRFDVDEEDFPTVGEARERLGVPPRWRNVLGYMGPVTLPRGANDLLACIERVAQTHPAAGWLIGVDEGASDVLLRKFERLEEKGRVRLLRHVDDRALFYRALDAFVLPSYREGAPTRLMEAAATQVGALAYHLPAVESVVEHEQTGELIPLGDVDALVDAVCRAIDDPKRLENYGVRARARAMRRFDRQHVENQVFRMYDTVLELRMNSPENA